MIVIPAQAGIWFCSPWTRMRGGDKSERELQAWVKEADYGAARSDLAREIKRALDDAGIAMTHVAPPDAVRKTRPAANENAARRGGAQT